MIQSCIDHLTDPNAVIIRPASNFGVELIDHLALGQGLRASNDLPDLCQMRFDVGLGGFDQGLIAQTVAARTCPRVVLPHPILTDVEAQEGKPGLVAFQGVADATFRLVQGQPDLGQPCHKPLLAVLQDLTVFMEHDAVIRIGDDTSSRVNLGDRLLHPMQGNQGQQRGATPALGRTGLGGKEVVIFHDPRFEPSFKLLTDHRGGLDFG